MSDDTLHLPEVNRRQLLALTGATAAGALAGCGGNGGGPAADVSRDDAPDETDQEFVTTEFNSIDNNNYNPFDNLYYPLQSVHYLFGTFWDNGAIDGVNHPLPGIVDIEEGPFQDAGDGSQELVIEDAEAVLSLFEEYTWHDGDPVTAHDVEAQLTLFELMEDPLWELLDAVEVVDDYAIRLETAGDINDEILADRMVANPFAIKRDVYEEFIPEEPVEEMSGADKTRARGRLLNFTYQSADDVVGWGPWELVDHRGSDQEMIFELYEDHPAADDINFPRVKFEWFATKESRASNLLAGNFGGADEVPNEIMSREVPEFYREYEYARRTGWGWAFNYDHEHFQDRRVRQAFAYAIDRERVVRNSGLADVAQRPHTFDSGFYAGDALHAEYFGEGFVDQLTHYDHDPERAASILEDVGWSRDDGQWYDGDGEPVEVTINVSVMWPEQLNMAQATEEHLTEFGVEANSESQELVVYYGDTMISADYDMAAWITGQARSNPYVPLWAMWEGSEATTDEHNHPDEVEVPMPVGDPDGDLETVDVRALIDEIPNTPAEDVGELYRKFSWVYNQWLPVYCLNEERGISYLHGNEYGGPDPDEPEASSWVPLTRMMNQGHIYALGE